MASSGPETKLVAIVGPTASGKSDLALRVAKDFDGEIIAADSRTIYKDMDIGTAKPTAPEQRAAKHLGVDLVKPGESYNAASFQTYANEAIEDINNRGKLAILVGGTGLYVDSVLYGFKFGKPADKKRREELEKLSLEELQAMIDAAGYPMPANDHNRRHLVRTIERAGEAGGRQPLRADTLLVGLMPDDETLRARIDQRAEAIFKAKVVNETKQLLAKYGRDKLEATAGIVYKICLGLLDGEYDEGRAIELFKTTDWQYSRRQKTWFKRNPDIKWFDNPEAVYDFLRSKLCSSS